MALRVSTSQIYTNGMNGIGKNQSSLYKLQQQLSTGRRVQTPSDDPIAASRSVTLSQAKAFNTQSIRNQENADSKLSEVDSQLSYLNERLTGARDLLVQAGNTQLSAEQKSYIATEIEGIFGEVLGMANTQDSNGDYIFSGFLGDVRPYTETEEGAAYAGDQGKHLVQASTNRQIATNVTGTEVFNFKSGNGLFATSSGSTMPGVSVTSNGGTAEISVGSVNYAQQTAAIAAGNSRASLTFTSATTYSYTKADGTTQTGNYTAGQAINLTDLGITLNVTGTAPQAGDSFDININTVNSGTGIINQGSIQSIGDYNAAVNAGYDNLAIKFTETLGTDGKTSLSYQIYDMRNATAPVELTNGTQPYTDGQAIRFNNLPNATPSDFGISVSIDGTPSGGDTFSVKVSQETDVFAVLRSAMNLLNNDSSAQTDAYTTIEYSNKLAGLIQNLDQGLENINQVRASVGADMQELESLKNSAEDKKVQYASAISELVDLDYTEAISSMMQQTLQLQAAISAFQQTSNLSLFNS